MAKFKIEGLTGVTRALAVLPDRVAKKVIRQSIRKALGPVRSAVKAAAPVGTSGQIKKNVKLRSAKVRRKGSISFNVQIGNAANGGTDYSGKQYYAAFREFGHRIIRGGRRSHGVTSGGQEVGRVEGSHFMEHAFHSTAGAALATGETLISEGIEREAKSLGRGR
jgi:hypothetical protein